MARCGCGELSCACSVQADPECELVTVSGTGAAGSPYLVCVAPTAIAVTGGYSVSLYEHGSGTPSDPYVLRGEVGPYGVRSLDGDEIGPTDSGAVTGTIGLGAGVQDGGEAQASITNAWPTRLMCVRATAYIEAVMASESGTFLSSLYVGFNSGSKTLERSLLAKDLGAGVSVLQSATKEYYGCTGPRLLAPGATLTMEAIMKHSTAGTACVNGRASSGRIVVVLDGVML